MTIKELYEYGKDKLQKAGVESPAFDALCIIGHVFGISRAQLSTDSDLPALPQRQISAVRLISQRCDGYPLQYLLGSWSFMDVELLVGEGVLIPRDDTEVLCRCCIDKQRKKAPADVLDLCSGSGAIALALYKHIHCKSITAIEKSDAALTYLCRNIEHNRADIDAVQGDIFTCESCVADQSIDLLVSNPPYIKKDELPLLQREVLFEPPQALDGGQDGLKFYRCIINDWTKKLRAGGRIALELGEGQFADVEKMLSDNGYTQIEKFLDLGGTIRAVTAVLK